MKRRNFIQLSVAAGAAGLLPKIGEARQTFAEPRFKLSLAQWSFHKAILREKTMDPLDFAQRAKVLGFEGIEYVNTLYSSVLQQHDSEAAGMAALGKELLMRSQDNDIQNVLIMIDAQGNLAAETKDDRMEAVNTHKKWVDLAAHLGCHAIRVNLNGSATLEAWKENSADGLSMLGKYGAENGINILVENHGGFSSVGKYLAGVMEAVNMDNVGTLPDFGNFCIKRSSNGCDESYDKYVGMAELMPHALALSAKSNNFDENGMESGIDYPRIMEIVKKSKYSGFIGVEYEGNVLSEEEGIIATRDLLKKLI